MHTFHHIRLNQVGVQGVHDLQSSLSVQEACHFPVGSKPSFLVQCTRVFDEQNLGVQEALTTAERELVLLSALLLPLRGPAPQAPVKKVKQKGARKGQMPSMAAEIIRCASQPPLLLGLRDLG